MVTQASIYIRRERAFVASVVRLKVILDDEIVAEVANGSYVELFGFAWPSDPPSFG